MKQSRGLKSGGGLPKLTEDQREVLHSLSVEFLTVKQIAIRRQTSVQAVYKVLNILKRKGYIDNHLRKVENSESTFKPFSNKIRLHGEEYNIKIIDKGNKYRGGGLIYLDDNTIRLYRDSVEVYSGKSFFGDDVSVATRKAIAYWNRFFVRLEGHLGVILVKPRSTNIRCVNAHYSECNNQLAEEYEKKGLKLRVYARDDGKLAFLIDNSFNLHELEGVHPRTSKPDMERVKSHFNDLRDNKHIPLSQLSHYMADTQVQINEISHGLKMIVDMMKPPIPDDDKKLPEYFG